mmetsp:Transcript_7648/g.17585  ORF Transcript_7648/g.17585 Transcript_7648/m.17585 type:complete len:163 (-) Transcript_7648:25-513(-)
MVRVAGRMKLAAKHADPARGSQKREPPKFELTLDALQGRWRHSVAKLGMLTVRETSVVFDEGNTHTLIERAPGRIEMAGWFTVQEQSCDDAIVWVNRSGSQYVRWLLEEDADAPGASSALEALDSRNIIHGKRRRIKVSTSDPDSGVEPTGAGEAKTQGRPS